MPRATAIRITTVCVLWLAVLGVLRYEPWRSVGRGGHREHLTVGFLPVT